MNWLHALRTRLSLLFARHAAEARMDEEFRLHIEMETEKNIRAGMDPQEARRRALIAFGGVEYHKELMRDGRGARWLEDFLRDLRYAARSLGKTPGFTLIAVLTIAVGVGATTIVYSMVNAALLRPLPVPSPDRLFALEELRWGAVWQGVEGRGVPYVRYVRYREATQTLFTGLAAHRLTIFSVRVRGETMAARGVMTSGNYFSVLGLHPEAGSFFARDDEPSAVIAYHFWRDRFGSDPDVLGSVVHIDGQPFTIVGVAPRGFTGTLPGMPSDVWVPVVAARRASGLEAMAAWLAIFGRLRPGVEPAAASALVDATAKHIPPDEPQTHVRGAMLEPLTGMIHGSMRDDARTGLTTLFGTALLVLLIASANIAGMLLARGVALRREIGIRLAIGAGRGRLVRQLMTEYTLLALLGGAGGVLLAVVGARVVAAAPLFGSQQLALDLRLEPRVLGFALALTMMTALLSGLYPALQASRPALLPALRDGDAGPAGTRARSLFVSGQLAMAVVLLVLAGNFVRSLQRTLALDLGYDPEGVVIVTTDVGPLGYDETRGRAFYAALVERVRALPGVTEVALAGAPLLGGGALINDVRTAGGDETRHEWGVPQNHVAPGFFTTLRLPLVAGREFTDADRDGAPRVAIVNQALARRLWPDEEPLGKVIDTYGGQAVVVGVARDGRYGLRSGAPGPYVFVPVAQRYSGRMTLHVRHEDGVHVGMLIRRIREEVQVLDANVAVQRAEPLSGPAAQMLGPMQFATGVLGLFGVLGVALAGVGLYGVLAFQVARRSREYGIRIALGAPARAVVGHVVGRWTTLAAVSVAAGLVLGHAAARVLERALHVYGLGAFDPTTFMGVAVLLGLVAVAASCVPVVRAVRIDPVEVMRVE
ncbi:MAG: ABC transporter permease [bacterium]|jgi:predicted permease